MDELFGVLRAHLSAKHRDSRWYKALWALIQQAHSQDPARYFEQWVPYLSALSLWSLGPLAKLTTGEAYHEACAIAPFARFSLYFYDFLEDTARARGEALFGDRATFATAPTAFRRLGQLDALEFAVSGEVQLWLDEWEPQTFYLADRLLAWASAAELLGVKRLCFGEETQVDAAIGHVLRHVRAEQFTALESLEFVYCDGPRALRALEASLAARLRHLRLISSDCGDVQTWRALSERVQLAALEELALHGSGVVDESVPLIVSAAPQLKVLDLSCNRALGADGVRALASASMLSTLEDLDLTEMALDEGLDALLSSELLWDVTQLQVTTRPLMDAREEGRRAVELAPEPDVGRRLTLRVELTDGRRWVELLTSPELKFKPTGLLIESVELSLAQLDVLLAHERFVGLRELALRLPEDASLHEAYVARLARHAQSWSVLWLYTEGYTLSPGAMALLTSHERFAQVEGLGVAIEPERQASALKPWAGLKRLRLNAYPSEEMARLLVDEFHALAWLDVYADGAARQIIAQVPRLADGMRAAGAGYWCDYPWFKW